jgi:hypothetical protein
MTTPPINARFPLLVVKRVYYEQFAAGTKTIEYRLHRKPFTKHTYYPGRFVRLAYNYDVKRYPSMLAIVRSFEVVRAKDARSLWITNESATAIFDVYPDLEPDDELALITLDMQR